MTHKLHRHVETTKKYQNKHEDTSYKVKTTHSSSHMRYSKFHMSASFDHDASHCDHHCSSKTASIHYRVITLLSVHASCTTIKVIKHHQDASVNYTFKYAEHGNSLRILLLMHGHTTHADRSLPDSM